MLSEMDRNILKKLLEADGPVPNADLAMQYGAAVNTIRKEIDRINAEVERHGFHIVSRSAAGESIEITDEATARPYMDRLREQMKRVERMDLRYSSRVYYLIRRCIEDGGVTADGLCQELFCSRSALTQDLKAVREILSSYHLTLKNGRSGLSVAGSEWNIRQCITFQCQIWNNIATLKEAEDDLYSGVFPIFQTEGQRQHELIRREVMAYLSRDSSFRIPKLQTIRIGYYIQICLARSRFSSDLSYTQEQIKGAAGTPEHALARELCGRIADLLGRTFTEEDMLGLAMLFLSFETENDSLEEREIYPSLREETEDLAAYLSGRWGIAPELFTERFKKDFTCFLYALRNRLLFDVRADGESIGYVKRKGLGTTDFCIDFARFYRARHGVMLDPSNTLSAFYLFYPVRRMDSYCYYQQNILVISRYGYPCAKAMETDLLHNYGEESGMVSACELLDPVPDGAYDLLLTDWEPDPAKERDLPDLPHLVTAFVPARTRCPELDRYLEQVRRSREREMIGEESFKRTDFHSKEEVFRFLAGEIRSWGACDFTEERLIKHLKGNDTCVEQERENGIVYLPVLTDPPVAQRIVVLLNETPLVWDRRRSRIFLCYGRAGEKEKDHILGGILMRFERMSAQAAHAMLEREDAPMEVLYP